MAQSVNVRPQLGLISRFVSSSPASGSLLSVRTLLRILCPPLCHSPACALALSLSLSLKNKQKNRPKKQNTYNTDNWFEVNLDKTKNSYKLEFQAR